MSSKYFLYASIALIAICSGTCANDNRSTENNSSNQQTSSVETRKANTKYKPAFTGQTRIAAVKTTTTYKTEKISEKIANPFALVAMPDGRLFVTSKKGYGEIHDANGKLIKKITGFPAVVFEGQGGLLDVAFDPNFSSNKMVYWSFSEKYSPGNLTAVAKGKLNEAAGTIENPTVIFRATPALNSSLHFGSRLVFDKSGNLFVSTGERFIAEGRAQAQNLNSHLGKIFRITTEGKAAPGNPFINKAGVLPEIYSYGHRNVQGLDINPATGDLWETEFGPMGGDELNCIKAGKNFGWPVITYGLEYSGEPIGNAIQQKEGMEQPVYYWDPVISPSGIAFYNGDAIPEWKNNLFIACLNISHIDRIIIANNKVVGEERLLANIGERFRDITYNNGMLYAITDAGSIYKISKK